MAEGEAGDGRAHQECTLQVSTIQRHIGTRLPKVKRLDQHDALSRRADADRIPVKKTY